MNKKFKHSSGKTGYPTDVSDQEWEFCAPCLTLMDEDAPQREYPLRLIFNALRWQVRSGGPWRLMPHDLPPWTLVYQQAQRWMKAGGFEVMAHDLRVRLRLQEGRKAAPSAIILDGRTLTSMATGFQAGWLSLSANSSLRK